MIGTILKWAGAFILCFVLQSSLVPVVGINGITPDFMLLILFLLGIRTSVMPAVFAGFIAGLCQDVYTPSILGQHALAMTVTGAFFGVFNEKVMRTDPLIKFVLLLIAFIIHDTLFSIVSIVKIDAPWTLVFVEFFTHTIWRALYSIAAASFVYFVSHYLKIPNNR